MIKERIKNAKDFAQGPHNNAPLGLRNLLKWMIENWGIENIDNDYRSLVRETNEIYYKLLLELDEESINYIFPEDIRNKEIEQIKKYIDTIDEIIKLSSNGGTREAYNLFYDLMSDDKGGLWSVLQRKLDNGEKDLYRIRKISPSKEISKKDLFHIPLDLRYKVGTCRFSYPGYPCLYLGTSIKVCWKELGRPNLSEFMVVKVGQQVGGIKVIDLSLPTTIDQLYLSDIWKFIKSYPFIVACGIKVFQSQEKVYKEEYIIPQMLTEYLIESNKNAQNENITAIRYTSTHLNKDCYCDLEKFTNIAIPIIDIEKTKKYCPKLKQLFLLSVPISFSNEINYGILGKDIDDNLWERMETSLSYLSLSQIEK